MNDSEVFADMIYGFLTTQQSHKLEQLVATIDGDQLSEASVVEVKQFIAMFINKALPLFDPINWMLNQEKQEAITDLLVTFLYEHYNLPFSNEFVNQYINYTDLVDQICTEYKKSVIDHDLTEGNWQLAAERSPHANASVPVKLHVLISHQVSLKRYQSLKAAGKQVVPDNLTRYQAARSYYRNVLGKSMEQQQYLKHNVNQLIDQWHKIQQEFQRDVSNGRCLECDAMLTQAEKAIESELSEILIGDIVD